MDLDRVVGLGAREGPVWLGSRAEVRARFWASGWMGRPIPGPYARSGAMARDGLGLLEILGVGLLGRHGSKAIHPKIAVTADEAAYLLEGLVRVGVAQIAKSVGVEGGLGRSSPMPILRGIQAGTVRYEQYDPEEEWKTWGQLAGELRETGRASGDCEDLSSAVAAELRYAGIPARTYVYKSGPRLYHVVVKTDRWGLLDPSRAGGMEGNG